MHERGDGEVVALDVHGIDARRAVLDDGRVLREEGRVVVRVRLQVQRRDESARG